jgi:CRISPR-associated endonuclease Cas2
MMLFKLFYLMAKKKPHKQIGFVERMLLMRKAGFSHKGAGYQTAIYGDNDLESLETRIAGILEIGSRNHIDAHAMLYFIMYDIENNKIRSQIAKYLLKKGCLRVQKSIFFAESERAIFNQIHADLKAIQELYDNQDSIFFVPISTDQVRSMKIVGQSIDFDLIVGNRNTLFF